MKNKKILIGAGVLVTAVIIYIIASIAAIKNGLKINLKGFAIDSFDPAKASVIPAKFRFKIDNFTNKRVEISALQIEAFSLSGEKLGAINMPDFRQTYDKRQTQETEVIANLETSGVLKLASKVLPEGSTIEKLQSLLNIHVSGKVGEKIKVRGSLMIKAGIFPAFRKNFEFVEEI